MACWKFSRLLISFVVLGSIPTAHAQGTNQYGGSTAVRTGQGPLSQPIPPATSRINPYNYAQTPYRNPYYYPQTRYRPQYYGGPAVTNPPQYPFGIGPQ